MKHSKIAGNEPQNPAFVVSAKAVTGLTQIATGFVPAPDAVARKAYFSYVNQGSLSGHEVQHWLAAEAELIAERKFTRTHIFPTGREIIFK